MSCQVTSKKRKHEAMARDIYAYIYAGSIYAGSIVDLCRIYAGGKGFP